MRVLIAVTHLLGTGHLRRAAVLADAFRASGHAVTLVSGGMPMDHGPADLVQLPPVRSDGIEFTRLLTPTGDPADPGYLRSRRSALLAAYDSTLPDVVITELFPFGRRVLRDEFMALLETARNRASRPLVLCSIRDILAPPSRVEKARRTEDIVKSHYDGVLVHSDPAVLPLKASWPVTPRLAQCLHYTGFVAPPSPPPPGAGPGAGEILVSAGGGAVGGALFDAAARAARLTPDLTWRLLIGGADAKARADALAAPGLIVEPARPDFRAMLGRAAVSVGMCGYNTAMDILQTGVPALFIPFDAGGETEQTLRATRLARLPGIELMSSAAATPGAIAHAVRRLAGQPRRNGATLEFDGARRSVAVTRDLLGVRT